MATNTENGKVEIKLHPSVDKLRQFVATLPIMDQLAWRNYLNNKLCDSKVEVNNVMWLV